MCHVSVSGVWEWLGEGVGKGDEQAQERRTQRDGCSKARRPSVQGPLTKQSTQSITDSKQEPRSKASPQNSPGKRIQTRLDTFRHKSQTINFIRWRAPSTAALEGNPPLLVEAGLGLLLPDGLGVHELAGDGRQLARQALVHLERPDDGRAGPAEAAKVLLAGRPQDLGGALQLQSPRLVGAEHKGLRGHLERIVKLAELHVDLWAEGGGASRGGARENKISVRVCVCE